MLACFEHIILWPADLSLFLDRINGLPQVARGEEKMARLQGCDGRVKDRWFVLTSAGLRYAPFRGRLPYGAPLRAGGRLFTLPINAFGAPMLST